MSRDRIDVKPDLKAADQIIRKHLRRLDPPREEKKVEKKLRKGLTLRRLLGKIFSPVRKGHKVMMTNEEILNEVNNAPRYQINYERLDGKTNEYTVAITERHPDHIKGYKFANGESCGIRRFNIAQINHLELVS